MEKSLDKKLDKIRNGNYQKTDFIIADAKDGDMGGGVFAPGPVLENPEKPKPYQSYLQAMREMTDSGLVDIMLMSSSSAEKLVEEKIFHDSEVTPAVRYNDTTDVWGQRHSNYKKFPSRNFRTAHLSSVSEFVDLGLYSITFSNDLEKDLESLWGFRTFLEDLANNDLRYFLEVFNPQIDIGIAQEKVPQYVNDCILKCLAGLTRKERPLFLKMPFNGPRAMEELCNYHPEGLIVGVLGGGKGTTRDTFELVRQSEKYGARVALFGRKINLAESPINLVGLMRSVIEGTLGSLEAVKEYHARLAQEGISPKIPIEEDQKITEKVLLDDAS